ncbi:MAG: heme lyase CcmF/NrfE family subunit, partial [Burkholderiales bacterium]|nr:heme lyase CcmF/NrfE family subunit [Burkholderiales bacterium]
HEGSVLLWLQMLAGWMAAVALFSGALPPAFVARVLGTMGSVSAGFLAFLLFTSNPFTRNLPGPAEGNDLSPLLQDPGMIVHPPLLYMGYVGSTVAFAFAVAALFEGRLDAAWARWTRPWALVAWAFLSLGILLGSFWAYYELGWGGWWFWDAVENASFMPWLVATALIHSLAVSEKRGAFRHWTVLLAILAFALSLIGTFLVRSGVLTSVHAFASDPRRGLFILLLIALLVGSALALYAWRARELGQGSPFKLASRATMLLLNNVLMTVAAGTVLLGTLYPLALDALDLGKISVGPPYFDAVFVPIMLPVLALMGIGPHMPWRTADWRDIARRLAAFALGAVVFAGLLALALHGSPAVIIGLAAATWIAQTTMVHAMQRLRISGTQRLGWWGMVAAHLGVAIFVAGVTVTKGFDATHDFIMRPGDVQELAGYDFRLVDLNRNDGPNYLALRANFEVRRHGRPLTVLQPEKRIYLAGREPMNEAAIDRGWLRDLYVTLGDNGGDGSWQVRIQYKPFMAWIWTGVLMMAAGGLLAAGDRRYRTRAKRAQAKVALTTLATGAAT